MRNPSFLVAVVVFFLAGAVQGEDSEHTNSGGAPAVGQPNRDVTQSFSALDETRKKLYPAWADFKRISLSEQLQSAQTLFPDLKQGQTIPRADQPWLYYTCKLYEYLQDFNRLALCLDRLDDSLIQHGESQPYRTKPGLFGTTSILAPMYIFGAYPLGASVALIRADVALTLGDTQAAIRFSQKADQLLPWVGGKNFLTVGSESMVDVAALGGSYYTNAVWQVRLAKIMAVAYFQVGEKQRSRSMTAVIESAPEKAFFTLYGKASAARIETLAAIYSATERQTEALALLEQESFAGERIFTLMTSSVWGWLFHGKLGYVLDPYSEVFKFHRSHLRVEVGRYADATGDLDTIIASEKFRLMGSLYWAALYDRGRIAENEGKIEEAISYYRRAIDEIERQRSTINSEGARIGFFGDRQNAYQALVRLLVKDGKTDEAFLVTERSKARALVDMLANKQDFRVSGVDADKVKQLLTRQNAADNLLVTGDTPPEDMTKQLTMLAAADPAKIDVSAVVTTVRNMKVEASKAIATLSPELASLVSVAQVSLPDIRQNLPVDETVISYFYDKAQIYAFLVDGKDVAVVPLQREGLEADIEAFRLSLREDGTQYGIQAQSLYARLIAPLLPKIHGSRLIIAPHGALHYLPFAALSDGKQYLIDRYQLTFLPSASTLKFVGKTRIEDKVGTLFVLGNPDLGDPRYDLAFAEREARAVGGIFPQSVTFLRQEATKKNLKEFGTGFKYLHFATHGKFDADNPLGSALMLAGKSVTDEKDRLTVSELYSMRLDADLVTLSACETGLGKVSNGDDVVGLVRGFLYAGANRVISTLWEIDDEATSKLMVSFYKDLKAGKPKAESLRTAQLGLRKEFPHPRYWAAFQMTGGAENK
jgi:CHAT domain-containing protein